MEPKLPVIVGAGPLGGILAARLSLAEYQVFLVDVWWEHIEHMRNEGLHIQAGKEVLVGIEHLFVSVAELGDIVPDFIFICTKAHGLDNVLSEPSDALKQSDAVFVSAQNGNDTEEIIARHIERRRILRGVISYAGVLTGPGEIQETFFSKSISDAPHCRICRSKGSTSTHTAHDGEFDRCI